MTSIKVVCKSQYGIPEYKHLGDSGMDVKTTISEPVVLKPLERKLFPTGLWFSIPIGYEIQVRPRSGLALNYGITVLNTPGTVDSCYRGEVGVILVNLSSEPVTINPGERIAQLVLAKVEKANLEVVTELLDETDRGESGYGQSGLY